MIKYISIHSWVGDEDMNKCIPIETKSAKIQFHFNLAIVVEIGIN